MIVNSTYAAQIFFHSHTHTHKYNTLLHTIHAHIYTSKYTHFLFARMVTQGLWKDLFAGTGKSSAGFRIHTQWGDAADLAGSEFHTLELERLVKLKEC